MSPQRSGLLFAAATALLWGVLPIFLKLGLGYADPLSIVWFRFFGAGMSLLLLLRMHPGRLAHLVATLPAWGWVCGLALAANYAGFMRGLHLAGPTQAQVLIQLAPIGLVLVGALVFGEGLQRIQWIGLLLVAVGLTVFNLSRGQEASALAWASSGNLNILGAAAAWILFASAQKLALRRVDPQPLNVVTYLVAALVLAPWADFGRFAELGASGWALMLFLALNTLLAYGALSEAIKRLPVAWVSVVIACNPLLTFVALWLLAAVGFPLEPYPLSGAAAGGACMVVLGAVVVLGLGRRRA